MVVGGLKDPLGYQGRSHFRPHIAIKHLLLCEFRGQIQKLSKISEFLNFVKFDLM